MPSDPKPHHNTKSRVVPLLTIGLGVGLLALATMKMVFPLPQSHHAPGEVPWLRNTALAAELAIGMALLFRSTRNHAVPVCIAFSLALTVVVVLEPFIPGFGACGCFGTVLTATRAMRALVASGILCLSSLTWMLMGDSGSNA